LIEMTVTNVGDEPLHRISAVTESDNPWLNQAEFYFGRIAPGESRTYRHRVALHDGFPSSTSKVSVSVQDESRQTLHEADVRIQTQGKALPSLNYGVELFDGRMGKGAGDGDGVPEVGETIVLHVTVSNQGPGSTADAFVRLKNRSGRTLDLSDGGFSVGRWQNRNGEDCIEGVLGCRAVLQPGGTHSGELSFKLRDLPPEGGWDLDLVVGDNRAYDYSVIQQGGFYDFFQLEEKVFLSPTEAFSGVSRTAPTIEVSKKPDIVVADGFVVISGNAKSEAGTKDVIVYHGKEKIYYDGGSDVGIRPFTVERHLDAGPHSFYILVRYENGLTATKSVHVWLEKSG